MKLKVTGIRIEAAHAAYRWEQQMGTHLEVDVEVAYRSRPKTSSLAGVITVEDIVGHVHRVSESKTYKLMETFASDIIDSFWRRHGKRLSRAVVRLRKIRPKSDRRIAGYEIEVCRESA